MVCGLDYENISLLKKLFIIKKTFGFSVKEGGILVDFEFLCNKEERPNALNEIHKIIKEKTCELTKRMWSKSIEVYLIKVSTLLSFLSLQYICDYIYTVLMYVLFFPNLLLTK